MDTQCSTIPPVQFATAVWPDPTLNFDSSIVLLSAIFALQQKIPEL
jgi:hypothetical protein